MKKMKRFLSILLIVAIGFSLLIQQNVYAGITSGDISEHDQAIISAKKYAKKAYKEYAQQSIENANRVIAALRLACNVFDATGSVDLTREAFAEYLGGEKGFIWVADDGSYALTKELIDEFKAFIKANAGGVHGSNTTYLPYTITTYSDDKEFRSFYSTSKTFFDSYDNLGGLDGILDKNGISEYELVVMTQRWNFADITFNAYNNLYHGKNVYNFYAYMPPNECNEATNFYCRNNVLNNLYYYDVGTGECKYYESLGTDFFNSGQLQSDGTLKKFFDCRNICMHKYSDYIYNGFNMITPDGASFMAFTSVDNAKAYFNSLTKTASSSGITINNYNKVVKYVNDDDPSGFIVVSPDDNIDVEPTDYTFDRPTNPGDSDDDEGNRHGGGSGSSATLGTVVSAINKLYDMVEQKLDKIISQIRTNNILTGLDLLNDVFNDYIKDFVTATTELGTTVKSKFPFCLPFVIAGALALTNKSATAPKFTIPFKYDTIGVNYDIVIDFSDAKWTACRNVIYYFTLFFYMFGLIYLTFKASKVKE